MAANMRHDLLYVGMDAPDQLAQMVEKSFGDGGVWEDYHNIRGYFVKSSGFVVCMSTAPEEGRLSVSVEAPTVAEQQRRAKITFERLAAADPSVSLTLVAEDDSVVRSRPGATHAAQRPDVLTGRDLRR